MSKQDLIKELSFEEKAQLLTGAASMETREIEVDITFIVVMVIFG